MSSPTLSEALHEEYWETYLVDKYWNEWLEPGCLCEWNFCRCIIPVAYCSKCKSEIKDVRSSRCETCERFIC